MSKSNKIIYNRSDGDVNTMTLLKAVRVTFPNKQVSVYSHGLEITVSIEGSFSDEDGSTLDGVINSLRGPSILDQFKMKKYAEIDAKTKDIIEQGFEFPPDSGLIFSLSLEQQATINGAYTARELLTSMSAYPLHWMTKDDSASVDLQDETDVTNFFLSGLAAIRTAKDSGSALKEQILTATSFAEVDAVIDDR